MDKAMKDALIERGLRKAIGAPITERDREIGRAFLEATGVFDLVEAVEPFAGVPTHGMAGGPLVFAQTHYEDGTAGDRLGVSPKWPGYIPHEWFARVRTALTRMKGQTDDPA